MTQNNLLISATRVNKVYDDFVVLKDIKLSIQAGEKIGLVGPNGIGKTTLLKILAQIEKPTDGDLFFSKDLDIGYIPQQFGDMEDISVKDYIGIDTSEIYSVFATLNLAQEILSKKIGELSGGEKTKVAVAKIILTNKDVLLLDEPTNNLDQDALMLLEKYVHDSNKAFLIISHDREFLNKTVTRIFEIDEATRELHMYEGNYSSYIEQRSSRIERQWSEYTDSATKRKHLEKVIDDKTRHAKFIENVPPRDNDKSLNNFKIEHGQRSIHKLSNHLKQQLENMDEVEKPEHKLLVNLKFEIDTRSGDRVFSVKGITKELPDFKLGPIDLEIQYGEHIHISGLNGSGKTTFLRLLTGELLPDAGSITSGTALRLGYLSQQESILPAHTVVEEFIKQTEIEEGLARRTLNRFGLSESDVHKKIEHMSSGERSRLILAILMSRKPNCLILDEPSNHLDFEILEALEDALVDYGGTLIVVSHDRYFLQKLKFDRVIRLEKGQLS